MVNVKIQRFSNDEAWNGRAGDIEGIVRDWLKWQNSPERYPFGIFERVLSRLSPPDLGTLHTGKSVRIPNDARDIPTVVHRYGETPVLYASAGVKRIITLAYLIVWSWHEHIVACRLAHRNIENRMVVLVDEMEAHLHPKWQREVLPSLTGIGSALESELEIQFIVATHSPLVMASTETIFDDNSDLLLNLEVQPSGTVKLQEIDFAKYGDVSSWLTSPVFNLKHARSREAETTIEDAKEIQLRRDDVAMEEVRKVSEKLRRYLSPSDKFWPRWIAFAERHGVKL